jgi:hypothetical protein
LKCSAEGCANLHANHFAACKGDTILQVHGIAPFVLNFVSPDDAQPTKKPK